MAEILISNDDVIIIDDDEDDGFQITSWNSCAPYSQSTSTLTSKRWPSQASVRKISDDEPLMLTQKPASPTTNTRKSLTEPQFRIPDYGTRKSHPSNRHSSSAKSPRSRARIRSYPVPATCLSPILTATSRKGGTLNDPIPLDSYDGHIVSSTIMPPALRPFEVGGHVEVPRTQQLSSGNAAVASADPAVDCPSSQEHELSPEHDSAPSIVKNMEVIDLDILEDDQEDELRILAVQNIHPEEEQPQAQPKTVKPLKLTRRNPSIALPWTKVYNYQHQSLALKPNKTVELLDGDFLQIKDIISNTKTDEIRIRGNRLQRTRDLNGLLERKMNELVLFLEVDLDDPRPHHEQGAVEVPITEIKKIRNLRLTNHKFPQDRNLDPSDFRNRELMGIEGGLTCRWKYTCTYATGVDRYHNNHKERRLERLRADECTSANALSDAKRRFQWRGETSPGGAYQSSLMVDETETPATQKELPISIESSPEPEEQTVNPSTIQSSLVLSEDRGVSRLGRSNTSRIRKRKPSAVDSFSCPEAQQSGKRPRRDNEEAVEETRRRLSTCTLEGDKEIPSLADSAMAIDVPSDLADRPIIPTTQTIGLSREAVLPTPASIDLMSSDLSTPPSSGSIDITSLLLPKPTHRLPGQKLTYGDAFCGGGGSTRGALMAGLHIRWGFDFNKHACSTWTANFPHAANYQESAHDFVSRCQYHLRTHSEGSSARDKFKVDILHLSPPCQFFSPAHTVDGQDDEMNVASLFAVQSVIEVARPRVVTLEQTFGIVSERFRWFFNALVQMFTSHEFSVRWAVIPLQSWGLPQRRMRLIIIASCPGEILPRMPAPTHAEIPPAGSGLKFHRSVQSVLRSIPPNTPDHDPLSVHFADDRRMHPWDSSKILPRAMTTSGGQNYHPDGRRDFTLREYACLQGFPLNHVFRGNYVKKQIGNAVPPVVAKVLFESIRRDLDRTDGIVQGVEVLD
ncbi:S-adenosyl-L-methionine-dependent methyltransferase [Acephala macrosclerotiorum]|nr:S-adenosyl-L-methionine-dependent methyltransferase [Acephala macrosclerotiorum]